VSETAQDPEPAPAPLIGGDEKPWPTFESTPDIVSPCPGWCVVVRDDPTPAMKNIGGKKLLLPRGDQQQQDEQRRIMATAFVVACGAPAELNSGNLMSAPCKPGDHVLTFRGSLATYKAKDKNGAVVVYEAIRFNEIAAVIEDPIEEDEGPSLLEVS
jgi:hypothetical protein